MRTDDGSIIYDCLNGKPEAFGVLIDKYKEGIYAFIYSEIRNFHDAQDVTQEVFIQAYRDLRKLKRWESFSFWLYRIARRRCNTWFRDSEKRIDKEFIDDQDQMALDMPSLSSYRDAQLAESVQEALDTLPDTYREVLILHYFGGMKSEEIAESLGTSPTAVRMRLSRAREQLKEEMVVMTDTAFEGQRLRAGFTFRIVEVIKRINVQPVTQAKGLPWGVSLGTGLIFAILMLGQHIQMNLSDISMSLPLPSDTKILKVGEMPVDAVKISTIVSIGNKGDGKGLSPEPKGQENALFMAPQAERGRWIKKGDMPDPRYWTAACEVNGKVYVMGGIKSFPSIVTTVEEYDPEKDIWKDKSDMSEPRGGSTCVVDGKIYITGGAKGFNEFFSTTEVYDPKLDKWERKRDMHTPRTYHSVVAVNGKIYAVGGWNNDGLLSAVEEYDPETDTWTKKASMPTPGQVCSATTVNDKIYVMGKVTSQFWPMPPNPILEEYDPKTDTWTRKSDMPTPRYYLAACELEGKIYAIGGIVDGVNAGSIVEIYDPITDTWTKGKDMLVPRSCFSAVAVNGNILVFGGVKENLRIWEQARVPPLPNVEVYDPILGAENIEVNGKLSKTWGTLKAK